MDTIPLWLHIIALVVLVLISGFFSIAETSMMALNRFRLGHLVRQGRRSAKLASSLLAKTDKLLGTILLGNNVVNTAITAIVTALAIQAFGHNDTVLLIATASVALVIIIFAEITPKVIGATWPERIALPAAYPLRIFMTVFSPAVWAVNLIVGRLLRSVGIDPNAPQQTRLSLDEMRTIVLESGHFIPQKHRSILLNLFDLERIAVDDVMIPRNRIEALDLATGETRLREQLATCYHNKLPVFEGEINRVVGILHVRRALGLLQREGFDSNDVRELLVDPYFIPSGTPVFRQLQFFQENRQRVGLVVDEYGEVQGLITLEDIIEEIIGEFTTTAPGGSEAGLRWDEAGEILVDGSISLRELNRRLGTSFPLDGPRTLNGLVIEALQDLPESSVGLRFGPVIVEILQVEDRLVRSARLRLMPERVRVEPARNDQADDIAASA
ncbi:MAG: HlyC/CorC family transporter [Betaproteobacteria bacterium]